jgi:hypothetical protein
MDKFTFEGMILNCLSIKWFFLLLWWYFGLGQYCIVKLNMHWFFFLVLTLRFLGEGRPSNPKFSRKVSKTWPRIIPHSNRARSSNFLNNPSWSSLITWAQFVLYCLRIVLLYIHLIHEDILTLEITIRWIILLNN